MKTYTLIDILKDEEQALLNRLAIVRRRITSVERGEALVDSTRVTVTVGAQSVSVSGLKGVGN